MKKVLSFFISLVLIVFSGCTSGSPTNSQSTAKEKTLTFWGSVSLIGDSEFELPQDDWILVKLLKQYEEEHEGVKVNYVYFEDENAMYQMIKGSIGSEDEPDMFITLSGRYMENFEGLLLPLNDMLSKDLLQNTIGWDTVTDKDGNILGVPAGGCDGTYISYNKQLIEEAGLDFENDPPQTIDEMLASMEKISKAGILPVIVSDEGWNSLHSSIFGKWWLQQEDEDIIERLMADEVDFESDEGFLNSYRIANECYEKGYINKDFVTNDAALTQFINGQGAMYISSSYLSSILDEMGDNQGVIPIPDYAPNCNFPGMNFGGSNQCSVVLKTTEEKEECAKLLNWLFQKSNSIEMQKVYSGLPGRTDITAKDLGWEDHILQQKIPDLQSQTKMYPELFLSPAQTEVYFKYGPQAIAGNMTAEELAKRMNEG